MIAITGANGKLGQLVISSLLKKVKPSQIIALVRNLETAGSLLKSGVQVRQADYDKPDTLKLALKGAVKLLLISGTDVGKRVKQHQAVIDAAKDANIKLLAYTSILKVDSSPLILAKEHKITEDLIKASGIPWVMLRNGWYSENYTETINEALQNGVVMGAANLGRFATATRADYAEAAATVLTTPGHCGQVYELCGDDNFTLAEYAAKVSKLSRKPVNYLNVSEENLIQFLIDVANMPAYYAEILVDSDLHATQGWLNDDRGMLSKLIGRPTTPISQSITAAL